MSPPIGRKYGALACLAALAACGQPTPKGREMSAKEVAKQLSSAKIEPGQWEATNEILSASAAGVPADMLKSMAGKATTIRNCITPEQAAKPDASFLTAQNNSNCTYRDFSMEGGKMTGTMTCNGGAMPGTVEMKMNGTYGPRNYRMDMDMSTNATGVTMNIKSRATGRRIGDCTAGSGEASAKG